MRRIGLLLGFLALSLCACGKYGPPERSGVASAATVTPSPAPADNPEDEQKNPL
jgi:hypothetical protein